MRVQARLPVDYELDERGNCDQRKKYAPLGQEKSSQQEGNGVRARYTVKPCKSI